jgi:hypothetical protein
MKILMAVLSVIGITGIYLRQVKQIGVLGLLGWLLFGAGYLAIMSVQMVGVFVLPHFAATQPGYVNDVLAIATGGTRTATSVRWPPSSGSAASSSLPGASSSGSRCSGRMSSLDGLPHSSSLAPLITFAIPLLPQIKQRLFAIPTSVAVLSLGCFLWREPRTLVGSNPTPSAGTHNPF